MPEHDALAVPGTRPGARDEAGQRLGGVDRVDEDGLGPGEQPRRPRRRPRSVGRSRRRAGSRRARCRTRLASDGRPSAATIDAISGRSSAAGRRHDDARSRASADWQRRRAGRPGYRRSPTAARSGRSRARPASAWSSTSRRPATWPCAPTAPRATGADDVRVAARPRSTSAATRSTAASRSARSAVASWWTVAPNARATRMPGPGRLDRRTRTGRGGPPDPPWPRPPPSVGRGWTSAGRW